jgi:hypothetical protein
MEVVQLLLVPRQHSRCCYLDTITIFLFFLRLWLVLKWGPLFDQRWGLTTAGHSLSTGGGGGWLCKLSLSPSHQSQNYFTTGGLSSSRQATWDSRPNTCCCSPYVTFFLTRGWVCRLQFLLLLASGVILRSESRRIMTTFYCLRFETPPTWRATFPYL